jgi:hypothetical protein
MSFELTLTISGLTLWVQGEERMFALLPSTPPEIQHHARLRFTVDGVRKEEPLDASSLDLSGVTGSGGFASLPPAVADVGALAGRRLPRRQLGPNPDPSLQARVILPQPTQMTRVNSAFWDLGPHVDIEMTYKVTWALADVPGDALRWELFGLRDFKAKPLPDLHPVNGKVEIEVLHLPDVPDPPAPLLRCGEPAHHFGFYYGLFGDDVQGPLPLFRAPPSVHECKGLSTPVLPPPDGSFYTCMMGMAVAPGA